MMRRLCLMLVVMPMMAQTAAASREPGQVAPLTPAEELYRLEARYDGQGTLAGEGTVRLKNSTTLSLVTLALNWDGEGSFEVLVEGNPVPLRGAHPEPVEFNLARPLQPGEEVEFALRFQRSVPELRPEESIRIPNWHPRLWWGYETHADYDVGLVFPDNVVAAASAPLDSGSGRYRASGIRSFGLFFARGHAVAEADAGETRVRVIFHPSTRECAELLLNTAVDAIDFYRGRFGFYPHPVFTILPGYKGYVGGFPFATAMVMIHSMDAFSQLPDHHWRWITAHEIGHQYWLEHVLDGESVPGWSWLMIGLGIWIDREYSRARGMEDLHPGRLDAYAAAVRRGLNTTVELPPEQIRELKFDYNSIVTHHKAFGIISALAAILGPETFERVHARGLREFVGRRLSGSEFRKIAEEESGQDLGWFFGPLLRTGGHASYEIVATDWREDAGGPVASVRLRQAGTVWLPVLVEARFEDGSRKRAWTNRLRAEQTLDFAGASPLREVVIDPDREFPLVMPPLNREFQELAATLVEMPWTGVGERIVPLYHQAAKLDVKDLDVLVKLALLLYDGRHYEMSLDIFTRLAAEAGDHSKARRLMGLVWQGLVLDLLGRREEALSRYREVLAAGEFPPTTHSQYQMMIDRPFLEERLEKPFVRP
jgi:hypothetical protein